MASLSLKRKSRKHGQYNAENTLFDSNHLQKQNPKVAKLFVFYFEIEYNGDQQYRNSVSNNDGVRVYKYAVQEP